MILRSAFRSLCSSLSRGLQTEAALELNEAGIARKPRPWPLDNRGEEIRTAKARRLGISTSPHKLNIVAKLVRGMTINEAERQMVGCRKKHSEHVWKTIAAAVTNARHAGLREDRLVVSHAFVGKGKYLRKIRPWHGKGRYGIEHKKYAHLTVFVRELDEELWEAAVMPKYIHLGYRHGENDPDHDRNHPIHKSDRVSWHSQLDVSMRATRDNIQGLRALLEGEGDSESAPGAAPNAK